jgi:hypothetical protein
VSCGILPVHVPDDPVHVPSFFDRIDFARVVVLVNGKFQSVTAVRKGTPPR